MKVYITKYALTHGIYAAEAERCANSSKDMIYVPARGYYHGEGKDWHLTHDAAIARAKEMQAKKLTSLAKAVKKIEAIKF